MEKLLKNKIVLLTKDAASESKVNTLINAGAGIIYFPTIKAVPIANNDDLTNALQNFSYYDYLVFTSGNAVEIFFEQSKEYDLDFSTVVIAAVGTKTAEVCRRLNIPVNLIPDNFSAEGLLNLFRKENVFNKKFLVPSSAIAKTNLREGLEILGASVNTIPIYNVEVNTKDDLLETINSLLKRKPDIFIFTSPSTFDAFVELMELGNPSAYFRNTLVTAIGPTTEAAIKERNVIVNVLPKKNTLEDLCKAIVEYYLFQEI